MTPVDLIALGGTISMVDGQAGAVPALGGTDLAAGSAAALRTVADLARVGGSEVDFALLSDLSTAVSERVGDGAAGVVITVGTDAIEELAMWLVLSAAWPVPVVITGAMVPGGRPGTDGPANLTDAIAVAGSGLLTGTVVTFCGAVYAGSEVLKVSGVGRTAFAAPGHGPIGAVLAGCPALHRQPPTVRAIGIGAHQPRPVPLVTVSLGDDGQLLRSAARDQPAVVIAANGAGNVPPGVAAEIDVLLRNGTLVVVCSRTPDATTAPLYGYPGGSARLAALGAVLAPGVSAHRARVMLTIARTHTEDPAGLRDIVCRTWPHFR